MKSTRITFGTPTDVTNSGDDSRSFLFPFACVDLDLVGSPEETRFTSEHRLIVTVANDRLPAWNYSDADLLKVLFEIGHRTVAANVKAGTLQREVRVRVHCGTHSRERPYDPARIIEPGGAVFVVEEKRRIGFN